MENNHKDQQLINEKKCNGVIYGKCPWCEQLNVPLCCHHHPIPKAKGGKECISISFNCHFRFHFPKLKKKKIKRRTKKEMWIENMPYVIDLRDTKFKNGEEFYEFFNGDWEKALKFLKEK